MRKAIRNLSDRNVYHAGDEVMKKLLGFAFSKWRKTHKHMPGISFDGNPLYRHE